LTLNLKIVTPNELYFEGPVQHVQAPGLKGYFGILKNHAALVTPLTGGNLTYRDTSGKTSAVKVDGGFVEVLNNRVLVLTNALQSL